MLASAHMLMSMHSVNNCMSTAIQIDGKTSLRGKCISSFFVLPHAVFHNHYVKHGEQLIIEMNCEAENLLLPVNF